jgi:hypothetical protein
MLLFASKSAGDSDDNKRCPECIAVTIVVCVVLGLLFKVFTAALNKKRGEEILHANKDIEVILTTTEGEAHVTLDVEPVGPCSCDESTASAHSTQYIDICAPTDADGYAVPAGANNDAVTPSQSPAEKGKRRAAKGGFAALKMDMSPIAAAAAAYALESSSSPTWESPSGDVNKAYAPGVVSKGGFTALKLDSSPIAEAAAAYATAQAVIVDAAAAYASESSTDDTRRISNLLGKKEATQNSTIV